jgi:hypothetical protein
MYVNEYTEPRRAVVLRFKLTNQHLVCEEWLDLRAQTSSTILNITADGHA